MTVNVAKIEKNSVDMVLRVSLQTEENLKQNDETMMNLIMSKISNSGLLLRVEETIYKLTKEPFPNHQRNSFDYYLVLF